MAHVEVRAGETTACTLEQAHLEEENWTDEQRWAEPGAGLVSRFDTDAIGRPAAPFDSSPTWWTRVVGAT